MASKFKQANALALAQLSNLYLVLGLVHVLLLSVFLALVAYHFKWIDLPTLLGIAAIGLVFVVLGYRHVQRLIEAQANQKQNEKQTDPKKKTAHDEKHGTGAKKTGNRAIPTTRPASPDRRTLIRKKR